MSLIKPQIIVLALSCLLISHSVNASKIEIGDVNKLGQDDKIRATKLYNEYEKHQDNYSKQISILEKMMEIGRPVAQKMFQKFDRELRAKWPLYQKFYVDCAKKAGFKKTTSTTRQEILLLEQKVQDLRKLGEKLTKNQIKQIGDPALNRLKNLKVMKVDEVFAINPSLQKSRDYILHLIKQRKICMDRLVLLESDVVDFGMKELLNYEKLTSTSVLGPPREYMQILEMNDKNIENIKPSEVAAVRNLNEYRILIGLRPCIIDPKLCLASREHSKDMERKGFFAHDSPIKGKKTPWDRAKLAGTTANAENIYKGSQNGESANRAWWYSPGHHVNMLNPNAKRIGMGLSGKHWTQMFGP